MVGLAACSSSSPPGPSANGSGAGYTRAGRAAAARQVTASWSAFFDGKAPAAQRLKVLQDASDLSASFERNAKAPFAATTAARVDGVTVLGQQACGSAGVGASSCARVIYDLLNNTTGAPFLTGELGYAVYAKGEWLVSKQTYCSWMSLYGQSCTS